MQSPGSTLHASNQRRRCDRPMLLLLLLLLKDATTVDAFSVHPPPAMNRIGTLSKLSSSSLYFKMNKKEMAKFEKEFADDDDEAKENEKNNSDNNGSSSKVTQMAALLSSLLLEKALNQAMSGNEDIDMEALLKAFSGASSEVEEAQTKAQPVLDAAESAVQEKLSRVSLEDQEKETETIASEEGTEDQIVEAAVEIQEPDVEEPEAISTSEEPEKDAAETDGSIIDKPEQTETALETKETSATSEEPVKDYETSNIKQEIVAPETEENQGDDETIQDETEITASPEQQAPESVNEEESSKAIDDGKDENLEVRPAMIPQAISLEYGKPLPVIESDVPALRPESIPKAEQEQEVVKAESSTSIVSQEETAPNGDGSNSNELIKEQKMKQSSSVDDSVIDEVVEQQIQQPEESSSAKTTTPTELTPSLVEASMTGKKDTETPSLPSSQKAEPLTPSHRNGSNNSSTIQAFRRQPKSVEEEQRLSDKYGALPLPDRAFQILLDLGMIEDTSKLS